jgi:hypothetical protein
VRGKLTTEHLLVQVRAVFAELAEGGFAGGAIWRGCDIVDIIN